MARPALSIEIRKKDQQELRKLVKGGVQPVRVVLRALALLQLAEHASAPQIAKVIPLTAQAIRRSGNRYDQPDWMSPCMRNSDRARPRCWTATRNSASSPW